MTVKVHVRLAADGPLGRAERDIAESMLAAAEEHLASLEREGKLVLEPAAAMEQEHQVRSRPLLGQQAFGFTQTLDEVVWEIGYSPIPGE